METTTWISPSGIKYELEVHRRTDVIWNDIGGVYVFANKRLDGSFEPLYVGKTNSFSTRLPNHETWTEASRNGAQYILARVVRTEFGRLSLEAEMISNLKPVLNKQMPIAPAVRLALLASLNKGSQPNFEAPGRSSVPDIPLRLRDLFPSKY